MSRLIKASGEEVEVSPMNGETFTWEEVEGYVGGFLYPYAISLEAGIFWVLANEKNETEEHPDLPYNAKATDFYSPPSVEFRQLFYGDVIVADKSEWSDELYLQYRQKLAEEEYDPEDDYEDDDY